MAARLATDSLMPCDPFLCRELGQWWYEAVAMLGLGLRWPRARRRRFTATWGWWLGRKLIEGEERASVLPIDAGVVVL